jgi:hypothetical protein
MSKKRNNKKDNRKDRKNKLKYEKTNVKRSRKNKYVRRIRSIPNVMG